MSAYKEEKNIHKLLSNGGKESTYSLLSQLNGFVFNKSMQLQSRRKIVTFGLQEQYTKKGPKQLRVALMSSKPQARFDLKKKVALMSMNFNKYIHQSIKNTILNHKISA